MKKYLCSSFSLVIIILIFVSANVMAADDAAMKKGFRVQIYASQTKDEAILAKTKIEQQLYTKNIPVYIQRSDQWYKVRVGNCDTMKKAKKLLYDVKMLGYPDAWIVRTKILQ